MNELAIGLGAALLASWCFFIWHRECLVKRVKGKDMQLATVRDFYEGQLRDIRAAIFREMRRHIDAMEKR